jgi:prepilin-type N-terminal cleavage/methylation domain-containing protein
MTTVSQPSRPLLRAFTLIELLTVIAIIGILAAIAVPNIGRINEAAGEAKDRRNAQQIASVCNAAGAAGLDLIKGRDDDDKGLIIADVVTGDTVPADTSGPFAGQYFGVPNLSDDEQDKAAHYLTVANGLLVYSQDVAAP